MRRYDDPVEVRRGRVPGPDVGAAGPDQSLEEGPEQFVWRGRLWKVRAVLAHWVETGSWWQTAGARAVIGTDETEVTGTAPAGPVVDLLAERELWRVEAGRGGLETTGVFDLAFDWSDGRWQLVGCVD